MHNVSTADGIWIAESDARSLTTFLGPHSSMRSITPFQTPSQPRRGLDQLVPYSQPTQPDPLTNPNPTPNSPCPVLHTAFGLAINFTDILWKSMVWSYYSEKLDYQRFMGNYSTIVG